MSDNYRGILIRKKGIAQFEIYVVFTHNVSKSRQQYLSTVIFWTTFLTKNICETRVTNVYCRSVSI